jgi:photosystem II stability/assembly factor-like uncharacterized protein
MLEPEDLIQDEIEHPEQTQQLQNIYTPSREDQQSMLRIRTRLLAQSNQLQQQNAYTLDEEELQSEQWKSPDNALSEQLVVGQFVPPSVRSVPTLLNKPRPNYWRLVALVAILCVIILSTALYAVMHTSVPVHPPVLPHKNANPVIYDMTMTSATTGWGRGTSASDSSYNSETLVRTTDGGQDWKAFHFDKQPAGLFSYFALDDQTAWVALGYSLDRHSTVPLMRTTDGGQHWTTLSLPPEISQITFLDRQHGWAWDQVAVQEQNSIYQTVDGGKTWVKMSTTSASRSINDPTPGPLPLDNGFGLTFITPQHGWATVHVSQDYQRVLLYMTQDGGKTWQLQQLPQPTGGPIPGIHTTIQANSHSGAYAVIVGPKFFDAQHGILRIGSQVSAKKPREIYLYETNDGGQSWLPLGNNIEDTGGLLLPVSVVDATHVVLQSMYPGSGAISMYALVNGQWQKQQVWHFAGVVYYVYFVNSQFGWVVSDQSGRIGDKEKATYSLYATNDGGKSWNILTQKTIDAPIQQG